VRHRRRGGRRKPREDDRYGEERQAGGRAKWSRLDSRGLPTFFLPDLSSWKSSGACRDAMQAQRSRSILVHRARNRDAENPGSLVREKAEGLDDREISRRDFVLAVRRKKEGKRRYFAGSNGFQNYLRRNSRCESSHEERRRDERAILYRSSHAGCFFIVPLTHVLSIEDIFEEKFEVTLPE